MIASYERPIYGDWLRAKGFVSWNDFTASDVGLANEQFTGDGWTVGGELSANPSIQLPRRRSSISSPGLAQHVSVNNEAVNVQGDTDFVLPSFGSRFERSTDTTNTNIQISIETNLAELAGTDADQINKLGRLDVDRTWTTLQWDASHSFYLDPLFYGARWNDTEQPGQPPPSPTKLPSRSAARRRLTAAWLPGFEQVVGGLYTVRGYPESVVAGDTVIVGSVEYRLHVPQAFGYDPNPGTLFGETFRYQPQQPYGRADWDLILKGFVDGGATINSHKKSYENDETLWGTGFGAEFLYKRNFSVRRTHGWGIAQSGTSRITAS